MSTKKILLLAGIVNGCLFANAEEEQLPISFRATYTGDFVTNVSGGIKTGSTYLGFATISADFDTEVANLWKGGEARVNIGNTHGGEPTANLIGDFQCASNLEAGNHSFLYELWYKQRFGRLVITLGLQDLNAEYAVSEGAGLFNNSSFGVQSTIADNVPSGIFPLTALGANFQYDVTPDLKLQVALYDAPSDFETNTYNMDWNFSAENGYLAITEIQVNKSFIKARGGSYKMGAYYHSFKNSEDKSTMDYGLYFDLDQELSDKFSLFAQVGLSPKSKNCNHQYFGLGFNYKPFSARESDVLGLAVAYAGLHDNNDVGSETSIEMIYNLQVTENIYIKPDLQYIVNPAGTDVKLDNALVGMLRFGFEF